MPFVASRLVSYSMSWAPQVYECVRHLHACGAQHTRTHEVGQGLGAAGRLKVPLGVLRVRNLTQDARQAASKLRVWSSDHRRPGSRRALETTRLSGTVTTTSASHVVRLTI